MERVTSRQNPVVRRFREAARGLLPDMMLLDGEHLIAEAIASNIAIEVAAFVDELADGPLAAQARRAGAIVVSVTHPVMSAMSPVVNPSGAAALARRREVSLDAALAGSPPLAVVLADVQDPGNVGAIIRAAEGGGATGLVCGPRTADPFSWKALRGAMGSSLRLPIAVKQPLPDAIVRARARGLRVFATAARGGMPLPECDLRGPAAIVLGGEGGGLPDDVLREADTRITIPMRPPVESLNVAIAAALVIYEASRQRTSAHVAL